MEKKVLTEQSLYYGDVSMPKGFEINPLELSQSILHCLYSNKNFKFSKSWDKLNTYVRDFIKLNYNITLINKNSWGNIFVPNEKTERLCNVDPVNLLHSPDYTLLYGINTNNCSVRIYYEDNRRKGQFWDISLINNKFIMFPSINSYVISNDQKNNLNFIQTITYEYI